MSAPGRTDLDRAAPADPHRVAVLAFPHITPFHLAVPSLVLANRALRARDLGYDVVVCAEEPGALPTAAGYDVVVAAGLEEMARADTVVVPGWRAELEPSPALIAALRAAHARGARVVGLCLGAFPVAASGIADGREVATHWHSADLLARRYPAVRVRADVLWADEGDVVTSAGVAAALDCCLHLVRRDHGARVAAEVARSVVLAPHRDGSQAQFLGEPLREVPGDDPVAAAMTWALDHLGGDVTLDAWAARARMSRRTFTRRFRDRTGRSPGRWLLDQRLLRARELLETTPDTVDLVAHRVGFASGASLRQHFTERFGTTPARHRAAFAGVSGS